MSTRLTIALAAALMFWGGGGDRIGAVIAQGATKTLAKQAGWMLVAAPKLRDPRFARTVILMLHHDAQGAKGVILNRLISTRPAGEVMEGMTGKRPAHDRGAAVRVQYGGPVRTTRWTYIHSSDYSSPNTKAVTAKISLTPHPDILAALANGTGPAKGFLAIGYAGWGPGQLEKELRRKDWITIPPDGQLVLDDELPTKWRRAMEKRSVDL